MKPTVAGAAAKLLTLSRESVGIEPLLAMLDFCEVDGLIELERALTSRVNAAEPTAAQRRVGELLALSRLLDSTLAHEVPGHPIAPVRVAQRVYDQHRPLGAPSAETLVRRYGGAQREGWLWACRAAWGLLDDGRKTRPGAPWAAPLRGRRRPPTFAREEVIATIRECAFQLGHRPSSNVFKAWAAAERRRRRATSDLKRGGRRRVAGIDAVYGLFPSWSDALAAARITDEELCAARSEHRAEFKPSASTPTSPSALERLASLDAAQTLAIGLDAAERHQLLVGGYRTLRRLPYSRASQLADALGCSVAWLAGAERNNRDGNLSLDGRFDGTAFTQRRKDAGVREEMVLRRTRIPQGRYRRILRGVTEPTLDEALRLEAALQSRGAPTQR